MLFLLLIEELDDIVWPMGVQQRSGLRPLDQHVGQPQQAEDRNEREDEKLEGAQGSLAAPGLLPILVRRLISHGKMGGCRVAEPKTA